MVTASYRGLLTLRHGDWKAIFGTKWSGGHTNKQYGGLGPDETRDDPTSGQLYNLSKDPFETKDLWESHPAIIEKLRHKLDEIKQRDKSDDLYVAAAADAAMKPNVVLIFSDDMGYSDLPKFGKSEISTPNIDRLAQEGTLFTDAYVTAPICVASRMGLLTGQYQQRFGIYCNMYGEDRTRLFLKQTLLPAVFQDAGYRTAHVGKWHLSGNKRTQYETAGPRDRGFDESVAIRGGDSAFWKGTPVFRNGKQFPAPEYLTDLWGTEACAFIDRSHTNPFFLYLAYNAVHSPMHALDADQEKFPDVKDENRRIYDGMLLAMDRSIGRVLDRLDKHGIADNTILVFMNDNGGGGSTPRYAGHSRNYANNKPLSGHKFDVLEGGVRVPLIIRWPKHAPAGKVYREIVSSTDVFPTLVAGAGLQMPKGQPADGVDLLPFINGKNTSKPHEWLCWQNRSWLPGKKGGHVIPTPKVHNSAIRKGNWKLVRMNEKIGAEVPPPPWRLYDLEKDIGEQKDLTKEHGDVVKELSAQFDKWRSAMHPTVE
jgi:arylsulfatase A-like enzyme